MSFVIWSDLHGNMKKGEASDFIRNINDIPIYTTPTIILDDFVGRKGIGSSYGKKSINNLFYSTGTVINS